MASATAMDIAKFNTPILPKDVWTGADKLPGQFETRVADPSPTPIPGLLRGGSRCSRKLRRSRRKRLVRLVRIKKSRKNRRRSRWNKRRSERMKTPTEN